MERTFDTEDDVDSDDNVANSRATGGGSDTGGDAETSHAAARPAFTALAIACFVVVLAVIAAGLSIVVSSGFGYTVSFQHIIPVFTKKG